MKDRIKAYQSLTMPRDWTVAVAADAQLRTENRVLVVQRLVAAGAEHRFSQPLQAKNQQQPAHHQPQAVEWDGCEGWPEGRDDGGEGEQGRTNAEAGGPPVSGRASGQHDGHRLDRFDGAGQEHRNEQRSTGHEHIITVVICT